MLTPSRLRPGDRLAAVSLSWGGPGAIPHRYEIGKWQLQEAFGVHVVEMPHTLADPALLDARPDLRAADLHQALSDPDIAGIVSTIGGDDSIRLLPYLDLDLIAANPKVLLGYSDTTITQMAFLRAGVTSFYGPAVMAGFAENGGLHHYLVEGVRRTLFDPTDETLWPPNEDGWTVEFSDWADPTNQERPRSLQPSSGPRWLGGEASEGTTVVGCLEVLDWLRGTEWWPSLEGAVLLLETSEEAPPPASVTRFLRVLAATGELSRLAGIVFGRPGGASLSDEDRLAYDDAILQVVRTEAGLDDLPVVTNTDFGHTDPIWTIPQGVRMRVDPDTCTLTLLEPAVI
ncbi:MAG TPA: S66 peptidase family protein [Acidimicrobiia bacterium]|nr:S66 peptidase family protein [Acidimicrobiia bacterium]